jgi:hypothetical protein
MLPCKCPLLKIPQMVDDYDQKHAVSGDAVRGGMDRWLMKLGAHGTPASPSSLSGHGYTESPCGESRLWPARIQIDLAQPFTNALREVTDCMIALVEYRKLFEGEWDLPDLVRYPVTL